MKPFLYITAVLLILTTAVPQDADSLQGSWLAVSAERSGKPADEVKGHLVKFTGKNFEISLNGKVLYKGTIRVDSKHQPALIDFEHKFGKLDGKTWEGVFEVTKDTLKICDNAPDITQPRPIVFTTQASTRTVSVVLERVKK